MKGLLAAVRWEFRLQLRSLRFRAAAIGYIVLNLVPAAVVLATDRIGFHGAPSVLQFFIFCQPALTMILAAAVAGSRSDAASQELMRPVLGAARLSSARYLFGRWIGCAALAAVVSATPLALAVAICFADERAMGDLAGWPLIWSTHVLPIAIFGTAAWLGAVTVTGGEIFAFALFVLGGKLSIVVLNEILFRVHLYVDDLFAVIRPKHLEAAYAWLTRIVRSEGFSQAAYATNASWDREALLLEMPGNWALPAAASCLILGVSTFWVRRTWRDLRPHVIRPDHPLRTYLPMLHRARSRMLPSASLARADRITATVALLLAVTALSWNLSRQRAVAALGQEMYEVQTSDQIPPTAESVRPVAWKVEGELKADGSIETRVEGILRNSADEPVDHFAFMLNDGVRVESASSAERTLDLRRFSDRIGIRVDPPLGPGETLTIDWKLAGTPGYLDFSYWYQAPPSFVGRWERYRHARFPRELADLSTSYRQRMITPAWANLGGAFLAPIPRYTPWTLEWHEDGQSRYQRVPQEASLFRVDWSIDLRKPPGYALADSCGHLAEVDAPRLQGACRPVLSEYRIHGGTRLQRVSGDGPTLLAYPEHHAAAERYHASLRPASSLVKKIFPDADNLQGVASMVILENPGRSAASRRVGWVRAVRQTGRLLKVDESALLRGPTQRFAGFVFDGFLPTAETLAADAAAEELFSRRTIRDDQRVLARHLLRTIMMRRLGVLHQKDARLQMPEENKPRLLTSILTYSNPWQMDLMWRARLPAVIVDLEERVGTKNMTDALFAWAQEKEDAYGRVEPADIETFFTTLSEVSGVDLKRFYEDFFVGSALPELELKDVSSRPIEGGFEVVGTVSNRATGQIFCPVTVRTAVDTQKVIVALDTETEASFRVVTESRPELVVLDPEGVCHRWLWGNATMLERVDLLAEGGEG